MKILITGVNGFIGCHLAAKLVKNDYDVIGLDCFNSSAPNWLNKIRSEYASVKTLACDICDVESLRVIFKEYRPEVVVHLASKTGVAEAERDKLVYNNININGLINIINVCRDTEVKHLIYASSSSVYGNYEGSVIETTQLNPIGHYGVTKVIAENLLMDFYKLCSANITVVRPFTVFGPMGRPDMAPWIFSDAIINGRVINLHDESARDFTYIDDVVKAFQNIIKRKLSGFNIINIASGKPHKTSDLINELSLILKFNPKIEIVELPPFMPRLSHANISKAKSLINWQPEVNFKDGVEEFALWYLRNNQKP
jgi:UDP-glucuronate 4-epimerase